MYTSQVTTFPSISFSAVREELVNSEGAHDYKGDVHLGADIEEIRVVLRYHLELLHHLGNLVRVVLDVSHHEVVLLGDDVTRHVDVRGETLSADVLQHQWWLQQDMDVKDNYN